jgi:protoporphyrin/coproporphyrin ferrochelatase
MSKKGVLLINLGSPESPTKKDVKVYLREFLMDKRVLDVPYLIRKMLVELIILPTRPKRSAAAYSKVWLKEGSPLVVISKKVGGKVQEKLDIPVELAMRYGNPSIYFGLEKLHSLGVTDLLVIPLYPHYAMSSYETVVERVRELKEKHFPNLKLSFIEPFYDNEQYIEALSNLIKRELPTDIDTILFSYHGLPERHIYKSDSFKCCEIGNCCFQENSPSHATCYRHQCYKTTELITKKLNLPKEKIQVSFQSRLLKDPWLKPYTDLILEELPKENKKKIAVITPAFVSDCLETLEEIAMEGKEEFLHAGGEKYTYIPCLNDDPQWIDTLVNWVNDWRKELNP